MEIVELLDAHRIEVDHVDGVPDSWSDVLDRLFVDLRDLGWRGGLSVLASRDGELEVGLKGETSQSMRARIVRAAEEARRICEDCGAAARENWKGRVLCSRCATISAAVGSVLESAPDDATLRAIIYEVYCAWQVRRRIGAIEREADLGVPRGYSTDEVFEELRRWSIAGPPRHEEVESDSPLARSSSVVVDEHQSMVESATRPREPELRAAARETTRGHARLLAHLRREKAWASGIEPATRSVQRSGISWETCMSLQRDDSTARINYHSGTLEIREPGPAHDLATAALAEAIQVALQFQDEGLELTVRPSFVDESLRIVAAPDIAVHRIGETDRVELVVDVGFEDRASTRLGGYARLGFGEVWHVSADAVDILRLIGGSYEPAIKSVVFPRLRRLTLWYVVRTAVLGSLLDARRYAEHVFAER